MRPRLVALALVVAIAMPAAGYTGYCGVLIARGNVHAVVEGQLYRSAQLDGAQLRRVVADHGIRSVLNLRGAHAESEWYRDELAVAAERSVAHYDIALSATRPPTPKQLAQIMAVLRTAPKPLLVHCHAGADRAGLVAALYRYVVAGEAPDAAARELSLRFGHFPYLTSGTGAMDESFRAYVLGAAVLRD